MNTETKTRNCPLCKEEIHPEAIKCKHCGSAIAPEKPSHEGTCPHCKEEIHPEAIKCKHCKSNLTSEENNGLGHNMPTRYLRDYPSFEPSPIMFQRPGSGSLIPSPFPGGFVTKKERACRTFDEPDTRFTSWAGTWDCTNQSKECCDIVEKCLTPVGGGKKECFRFLENCSTTPYSQLCFFTKK